MNYDQKIAKTFANTVNPLNIAPGVYLILEILEGFYWKGLLKEEALRNLEIVNHGTIIRTGITCKRIPL